ncbi:MAG: hypothetical protein M0Z61_10985 [Nitrospiraceae bacterium]|nr:hypothetical protein [Nitrospiraceae bacterium]
MKRMGFNNRDGSILIGLIITLVIVAIAGAAVVNLTTGSTLTGLLKNNNLEAYYLAESGVRFATPLIQSDLNNGNQNNMHAIFGAGLTNTPTYTLSTGQFTLAVSNVNATAATLTSTGIAGSGWLLTKRQDVIRITGSSGPSYQGQSNFSDISTNWNQTTNLGGPNLNGSSFKYDSKNNGLQYVNQGIPQLETGGMITFSSSNPMTQNLVQSWQTYGTLSYQLQEKVIVDNKNSNFFMIGLSFRVDELDTSTTPKSFYGVSFFRKNDKKFTQAPLWWWLLLDDSYANEFDSLKNDTLYVVFWEYLNNGVTGYIRGSKRTCDNWLGNGCFYLLDYSPLTSVASNDGQNLLPDSAIVATVNDVVSGGVHTNNISAYVAQSANSLTPYYYAVGTSNVWPPGSQFYPITSWTAYPSGQQTSQPLTDNSLTPDMYWTKNPPYPAEIGAHVFYDQNGTNVQKGGIKNLVTDFGMSMLSGGGSGGSGQGIQYY